MRKLIIGPGPGNPDLINYCARACLDCRLDKGLLAIMLCRVFYRCSASTIRRMTSSAGRDSEEYKLVDVDEVTSFAQRCLAAAGALQPHAATLAAVLLHADQRGHFSHGLNRLGKYASIEAAIFDRGILYFLRRDVL